MNVVVNLNKRELKELISKFIIHKEKSKYETLVSLRKAQQQALPEQPQLDPCNYTNTTANEWSGRFWGGYTLPFGF